DAGNPSYISIATDLDGRPRTAGSSVDIGAYEFQSSALSAFNNWLQQYCLPTDGTADYLDADSDGMNNWQEWLAGTDPTNQLSVLNLASLPAEPPGLRLVGQSFPTRPYHILRPANLPQPYSGIAINLPGQPNMTSYTDTTATNSGPYFYRIRIQ